MTAPQTPQTPQTEIPAWRQFYLTLYKPWKLDDEEMCEMAFAAGVASQQAQTDRITNHLLATHDEELAEAEAEIERLKKQSNGWQNDPLWDRYGAVVEAAREIVREFDNDAPIAYELRTALAGLEEKP